MILIFGGAYQGKLSYALERFGLSENDVHRCSEDDTAIPKKQVIYEIDKWILALIKEDVDVDKSVREFIEGNPDAVVIANDISCGVVSVDAVLRKWRETAGRVLAELSANSGEVVRMFCAIPTRIK